MIRHGKIGGGHGIPTVHGCETSGAVGAGIRDSPALGPAAAFHQASSQYCRDVSGARLAHRRRRLTVELRRRRK